MKLYFNQKISKKNFIHKSRLMWPFTTFEVDHQFIKNGNYLMVVFIEIFIKNDSWTNLLEFQSPEIPKLHSSMWDVEYLTL